MKFTLLLFLLTYQLYDLSSALNITCFNDCFYKNTQYYQGQYTWIVEEDGQCYCNNGTWVNCD